MSEFINRCNNARKELYELAMRYLGQKNVIEYNRLMGKVEGVELAQSYAEHELASLRAERDELKSWKDTVIEACIVDFVEPSTPEKTLAELISWNVKMALDPAVSKAAHDLIHLEAIKAGEREKKWQKAAGKLANIANRMYGYVNEKELSQSDLEDVERMRFVIHKYIDFDEGIW